MNQTPTAALRRPNVLFIMADQHRASATGCYGNNDIRTPHMDQLALAGARVPFCFSNAPLCCPYRASLMTGNYAHRVGVPTNYQTLRPQGPVLAEAFGAAGYATGYVGKFHAYFPTGNRAQDDLLNGYTPLEGRLGFKDFWRGMNDGHSYHDWLCYQDEQREPIHMNRFQVDVQADQAMEFLQHQTSTQPGRPWFLCVSWAPPHPPFDCPPQYPLHYANAAIPANVPPGICDNYARKNIAKYYGLIESVDVNLGRILAELDRLQLSDDTIVVYTSDHGELLASHGYMGHKRWPYDDSIRVPLLVRWPGRIASGQTLQRPVSTIDLYPTLLDLAGLAVPGHVDGRSAAGALRGAPESTRDEFVYCAMHYAYVPWPGWKALRSPRWLYAEAHAKPWLLFDLENDPLEMHNLVDDPAQADHLADLRLLLARRMHQAGDAWDFRLETGDCDDYNGSASDKMQTNDLGFDWPGGPRPYPGRQPFAPPAP